MTQETFKKAKMLEEQIRHLTQIIEDLNSHEYKLDPPIRNTQYSLCNYHDFEYVFNEGEVVAIRKALENEKLRLQQEFERL